MYYVCVCVFNLLQDIHQFALRQIDVYLSHCRHGDRSDVQRRTVQARMSNTPLCNQYHGVWHSGNQCEALLWSQAHHVLVGKTSAKLPRCRTSKAHRALNQLGALPLAPCERAQQVFQVFLATNFTRTTFGLRKQAVHTKQTTMSREGTEQHFSEGRHIESRSAEFLV